MIRRFAKIIGSIATIHPRESYLHWIQAVEVQISTSFGYFGSRAASNPAVLIIMLIILLL